MRILKNILAGIGCLAVCYFTALGVLYFLGFRVYQFPSAAMQPTVMAGERAVGRLSEGYRESISRFDLVIYWVRTHGLEELYARRVIGLPGEQIRIDSLGVKINGRPLALPAATNFDGLKIKPCDMRIPKDTVFVLCDHTWTSADSRFHGPTPKADIVGYLVFKK